jgi:hypothetical protein
VIVAVHNTMPYLRRCLKSLVRQSIGRDRLEVIAVDDGSTDGSGRELDRFALRYPSTFTVIHQTNSGGPAAPSNRALRKATGRYVFFLGADDHLGPEALERLVDAADRHGSDVVAGRMVGLNGRFVPQAIFERTDYDVDLYNSPLPFAISNTKLFRRSVVADNDIWFPEHQPFGSDQPFTVAACVHAKKISVLADYDYYFAVRRTTGLNITYRATHLERLRCTELIMRDSTARLLPPGPKRDAVMYRSFASELSKLTRADFLNLDRDTQRQVAEGIGRLVDTYLTDAISARLDVGRRARLMLAHAGRLDDLVGAVRQNADLEPLPLVADDGRLYAAYHGFRDARHPLPDDWFLVTDSAVEAVARRLDVTAIQWPWERGHGRMLAVIAHSPLDLATVTAASLHIVVGDTRQAVTLRAAPTGGTMVEARLPLRAVVAHQPRWGVGRDVRLEAGTAAVPLRLPRALANRWRPAHAGRRLYVLRSGRQADGEMAIDVIPVTLTRVARPVWERMFGRR